MGVTPFQSHTGLPRTKVVPRRAPLASSRNSFDAGSTDSARSGIPLPAGHGMFLPGQRSDEFLVYGPGAHGFQMARWRSGRQSTALIPYMGATPPILANGWGAFTGSEVTLHGRPVAAPKMLGVPATAGATLQIAAVATCTCMSHFLAPVSALRHCASIDDVGNMAVQTPRFGLSV